MAKKNDEIISTLNGLIETCKDGQEGFKSAAEGVRDHSTKNLFLDYSRQRAQFVGELQEQVRALGGDPEKSGSISGAMHRGWINLKSTLTGGDEAAMLTEAERAEDSAVSSYQAALEKDLPANVADLARRQYAAIKQVHDRVRGLRDSAKAAKA